MHRNVLSLLMHLSMVGFTFHIVYLGQMLEKGGGFAVRIFPQGSVLSRDCPNPLKWYAHFFHCVKCLNFM